MKASKDDLDNWLNDDDDEDNDDDLEIKEPTKSESKKDSKKRWVSKKELIVSVPTTDDFFAEFGV